jgi:hypothetical protein
MTRNINFRNISELFDIQRAEKYKYLGFLISLNKKQLIKDVELSIKKNLAIIRNKLLVNIP